MQQVSRFNPTVASLEEFKAAMTSGQSDDQIKPVVMAALSTYQLADLTKGLDQALIAKVEVYAKERSKQVLDAIKGLNALCDQRDELLESCSSYKTAKESFNKAGDAYFSLFYSDRAKAEQALKEVTSDSLSAKLRGKLQKIINRSAVECVCQSPWAGVYGAINELKNEFRKNEKDRDAKVIIEKGHSVIETLKWAFVDSLGDIDKMSDEEMDKYLQDSDKVRTDMLLANDGFEQVTSFISIELPNARKNAIAYHKQKLAEREARLAEKESALRNNLKVYLGAYEQYVSDNDYQKYAAQRKVVFDAIRELGAFCRLSELTEHSKITNDSKNRLYTKANKL